MWYRSSNKKRGFIHQIANKESRARVYNAMSEELAQGESLSSSTSGHKPPEARSSQGQHPKDEDADLSAHYWMSEYCASSNFTEWLREKRGDHALQVSVVAIVTQG